MTNATTTYADLVSLCARSAIEQGADDSYVCQHGDVEALADFSGSEPDATTRDELTRDVQAAIREEIRDSAGMYLIERMPEHLRASHEAAGNWGAYPMNGAERVCLAFVPDGIEDDDYDHVVRDATAADVARYGRASE
jgi:hypothetical protein